MTCLLLNTAADLSDPRVAVLDNRCRAAGAMCDTPDRLGWVVTEARDLLRRPDFAPEIARDQHLGNGDLVRIFKIADPTLAVKRFANRAAGAKRTAKMLLGKFITTNGESEAMEHDDEMQEFAHGPGGHEAEATEDANASAFTPTVGTRVTVLANLALNEPEIYGVVTEVDGNGDYHVTADPAYRDSEKDDGLLLCELRDLAPDPVGLMRERAGAVDPKAQAKADKAAAAAQRKADSAAKKAAAEADRAAKREARLAAKADTPKQPRPAVAKQRSGKQPKPADQFKVLRGGTIRERIVGRMDGTMTAAQIAEAVGLTKANTSSHIFCLWRDCGLGFEYDPDGRVRVLPPHGIAVANLFKSPEAAA